MTYHVDPPTCELHDHYGLPWYERDGWAYCQGCGERVLQAPVLT